MENPRSAKSCEAGAGDNDLQCGQLLAGLQSLSVESVGQQKLGAQLGALRAGKVQQSLSGSGCAELVIQLCIQRISHLTFPPIQPKRQVAASVQPHAA